MRNSFFLLLGLFLTGLAIRNAYELLKKASHVPGVYPLDSRLEHMPRSGPQPNPWPPGNRQYPLLAETRGP